MDGPSWAKCRVSNAWEKSIYTSPASSGCTPQKRENLTKDYAGLQPESARKAHNLDDAMNAERRVGQRSQTPFLTISDIFNNFGGHFCCPPMSKINNLRVISGCFQNPAYR